MNVLQICQKPPLPAIDGGCLASKQLSLNLLRCEVDLKIFTMATEKHPFQPDQIDKDFLINTKFEACHINTNPDLLEIFINLFGNSSIQKKRFYDESFNQELQNLLGKSEYELVVLDGLMTCFYLKTVRKYSKAKIIYRSHNIEYNVLQQLAENESNILKKFYIKLQSKRLKSVEISVWNSVDQIWSISSFDRVVIKKSISKNEAVITLPFSIKKETGDYILKKNTLFHLGAMDWKPNKNGIIWFINEVWPKVVENRSSAVLHLGGKSIGDVKHRLTGRNIEIHYEVKNANEFYNQYEIMIVPVKSGSGVRIKIIQALAKGKVIVSTKRGAIGIPAVHKENMIICDSSEEMSDALIQLLNDDDLKESISQNTRKLFDNNFHIDKVSAQLNTILESLNKN